jgi:acyl-coenzyme A synthetase/AMP-(fatty) acid ligase
VYIVDELPKSLIGKVLRKKVKEELLARDDVKRNAGA